MKSLPVKKKKAIVNNHHLFWVFKAICELKTKLFNINNCFINDYHLVLSIFWLKIKDSQPFSFVTLYIIVIVMWFSFFLWWRHNNFRSFFFIFKYGNTTTQGKQETVECMGFLWLGQLGIQFGHSFGNFPAILWCPF